LDDICIFVQFDAKDGRIGMAIGLRVLRRTRAVDKATIEAFRAIPVANVSDVMSRMTAGGPRLRPMHAGGVLAGPALTVKTRPGDNLMIHKALMIAAPGDVIVVDGGGDLTNSLFGEIMSTEAEVAGLAGLVLNGAIRDADAIRKGRLPVFAAGVTHRGPYKDGPGEINVPISLDGMVIEPGDLILGDDDGVLCVPFGDAATVLEAARKKHADEERSIAAIKDGSRSKAWVDQTLERLGCLIET
jgi:RraA family protein